MNFSQLIAKGIDLAGWKPAYGYWAEIRHGLMGNFPIIPNSDPSRMVICFERENLKKIWETLTKENTRVHKIAFLVNFSEKLVVCAEKDYFRKEIENEEFFFIFSVNDIEEHLKEESFFRWSPGLIGAQNPNAVFPEKDE